MEAFFLIFGFILLALGFVMILSHTEARESRESQLDQINKAVDGYCISLYSLCVCCNILEITPENRQSVLQLCFNVGLTTINSTNLENYFEKGRLLCSSESREVIDQRGREVYYKKDRERAKRWEALQESKLQEEVEKRAKQRQPEASVAGRAIVGGIIAGPAGAVIGAISAADKNNRNRQK